VLVSTTQTGHRAAKSATVIAFAQLSQKRARYQCKAFGWWHKTYLQQSFVSAAAAAAVFNRSPGFRVNG